MQGTQHFLRGFFITKRTLQRMRNDQKIESELQMAFSEIHIFLENDLLELHNMWQANALGNKQVGY